MFQVHTLWANQPWWFCVSIAIDINGGPFLNGAISSHSCHISRIYILRYQRLVSFAPFWEDDHLKPSISWYGSLLHSVHSHWCWRPLYRCSNIDCKARQRLARGIPALQPLVYLVYTIALLILILKANFYGIQEISMMTLMVVHLVQLRRISSVRYPILHSNL